jgi:hypothetical protein
MKAGTTYRSGALRHISPNRKDLANLHRR